MTTDQTLTELLATGLEQTTLSPIQWQALLDWEWADPQRAFAWGCGPDLGAEVAISHLQTRWRWLTQVLPLHDRLPLPSAPLDQYLPMYWQLWLPLAISLGEARSQQAGPLIQGILGGQGTGKTTLTLILRQILAAMSYSTVELSIDDLYKTYADRAQLRQADPRLRWRGPPGTHDIDLGIATLDQLKSAQPGDRVAVPRFDKSLHGGEGDRVEPAWLPPADIVLFEGWFVGARPISVDAFKTAPDPIYTEADRQFARDMNRRLADYLPLWDRLDRLMVICPEDYRLSKQWRLQAEHQMKAQGKPGMSDAVIDEFVSYFWQALHPELFITPLKHDPQHTDLVIEIRRDRTPSAIYSPR